MKKIEHIERLKGSLYTIEKTAYAIESAIFAIISFLAFLGALGLIIFIIILLLRK